MNHAKIAAALHALADAFLADVEAVETAVTGKKKKAAAAEPDLATQKAPAPAQSTVSHVQISVPETPEPATPPPPPPPPPLPAVTLAQVNKAVLAVAAKNRDAAVALLGKFGLSNTVGLAQDKWQAVYDAFEEEIARIDAAAVQVAQASLV